jgi:uncharacterized membrane protein
MSPWALALALVGAAAYAGACHELMVHAAGTAWAVAALLGPWLVLAAGVAIRSRHWVGLALSVLAFGALLAVVARGGILDPTRLYLLQHAGVHLVLGASFGLTLRQPLSMIGRIARRVHPLTPEMVRYTRRVTIAWVVYFLGMAALSPLVFFTAPLATWSLLANIVTPLAIVALFVGEHLLRYRLNPGFQRVGMRDAIQAYRREPVGGGGPAPAPEATP